MKSLKAAYGLGSFNTIWSSKYHFLSNYCNSLFINTTSHLTFLHQRTSQVTGDIYKLCTKHRTHIKSQYYEIRLALQKTRNAKSGLLLHVDQQGLFLSCSKHPVWLLPVDKTVVLRWCKSNTSTNFTSYMYCKKLKGNTYG